MSSRRTIRAWKGRPPSSTSFCSASSGVRARNAVGSADGRTSGGFGRFRRLGRGQGVARGTDAVVSHDDCFAVEFDAHPKARVFIVGLDTSSDVVRLYPSSCSPGGLKRGELAAHRFPADAAIGWDSRLGTETIFIIAARERTAAARIERLVRGLPAACSGPHAAGQAWLDQLDAVVDRLGDEVSVETLRIRHTPGRQHAGTLAGDKT